MSINLWGEKNNNNIRAYVCKVNGFDLKLNFQFK